MKNYLKHIDDFFREKLGRYRETPPPDVWEALDKQLDGLIPSAPKPSFRWGGHIAMVSLVAVLSIPVVKKILGNKGHQNAGNTELSIAAKAPVQQAVNTTTTEGGKVANGDAISAPLSVNGSTAANVPATAADNASAGTHATPADKKLIAKAATSKDADTRQQKWNGSRSKSATTKNNVSVNGHAKQNDKQNGKAKAGKLSEQIEETSGNGDQNSNKKVDAGAQNEDLAVNKQERPIQLQKKEVAKTKAAKKDKIATAAKPLFNRIELGMKAGYERGTNSNAASKYVISPYLQYNLSPKVALMTQPAIKYAQLSTRSIGNNQTYYKVIEGGQTKQNGASTPNVAVIGSTVDTISYTTNYTYTATYDSIIKSYKTGGAYLELELPILVKYKLGKKLSVYGGANFTYNKLTGIKENTFTKHDVTRSLDFSEVTPVLPVTTPVGPGIQYSGNPISNYNGPAYQVSTAGRLNVGYMLGFTYEGTHRWLFDALMEQSIVNRNVVGNYDVNAPLSSVYFRLSAGYKFIK